jgi:hypothetical protein
VSSTGGTNSGGTSNVSVGGTENQATTTEPNSGIVDAGQTHRKGMTWGKLARFLLGNLEWLGCNGQPLIDGKLYCDAIRGDTSCAETRPLLCIEDIAAPRPAYTVPESPGGDLNKEYYAGWSGGRAATTVPVVGTALTSRDRANQICRDIFGNSWRLAEFHDGWWISGMSADTYVNATWSYSSASSGGWSFFSRVENPIPETTRYWVAIDDQTANCWDTP